MAAAPAIPVRVFGRHKHAQKRGADVPRADVEDKQRTPGCDERPADREGRRRLAKRQIGHELGHQPGDQLDVSIVGDQQVPGVLQRLGQEDLQILGVDTVPGREVAARDAHQHYEDPEKDGDDLEEDGQAAR
jgi:hypothetical protein